MKLKILLMSMTILLLLSFAGCKQQGNGNNSTASEVTTEENLPEYTGTEAKDTTDSTGSKDSKDKADSEEDTEFTGLDVDKSTEVELEDGQDIIVD